MFWTDMQSPAKPKNLTKACYNAGQAEHGKPSVLSDAIPSSTQSSVAPDRSVAPLLPEAHQPEPDTPSAAAKQVQQPCAPQALPC